MIRALIFDCFGVFFTDPVFSYMHNPQTPPEKAIALHSLDEEAARGRLTKEDFIQEAAHLLGLSLSATEKRFFQGYDKNLELIALSQKLRKQYQIGLLSNIGGDMMDGFFSKQERNTLFDIVILSGDVKLAKPDPAIYKLICDQLGVKFIEAIMIDDIQSNCEAAEKLVMQPICYTNFEKFKAELDSLLQKANGTSI